jgi:hypothetical protein
MITRNTYPWMSKKWKEQEVDQPAREALKAEDNRWIKRIRLWCLEDVDSGVLIEFDERADPRCAGFPVGDSRRW